MRTRVVALGLIMMTACAGSEPVRPPDDGGPVDPPPPIPALDLVRPKQDGSGQIGLINKPMLVPLRVQVVHHVTQAPVAGIRVTWLALQPGGGAVAPEITMTDAFGYAWTTYTPDAVPGFKRIQATMNDQSAVLQVEAIAGPPSVFVGQGFSDTVFSAGDIDVVWVEVQDAVGNGVRYVPVTWTVLSGDAAILEHYEETDNVGAAYAWVAFGSTPGTVTIRASLSGANLAPTDMSTELR